MQREGRPRAVPSKDRALSPCRNTHARRGRQVVRLLAKNKRGSLDRRERRIEFELGGRTLAGGQPPQIDREPSGSGYRVLAALPGRERSLDQRADWRILRLPAHQAPDQFEERVPDGAIATAIDAPVSGFAAALTRSEERRVGKECRSRWSP